MENFGIQDESAVIGITDFDLTPSELSKGYRAHDAAVLSSGKPVINRVELWFNRQGLPDWYVANKFPVRSRSGKIVGVIGFLQPSQSRQQSLPLPATLLKAIQFIESAYAQPLSMQQLASQGGVSVRQLERQFKVFFGIHPSEFLTKTRVKAAAQLLWQTDQKLVAVALACGFTDQSALSRSFKEHVGLTPRQFRRLSLGARSWPG